MGVDKDYEMVNLNDVVKLITLQNGSKIVLPKGVVAVKQYEYIVFYKEEQKNTISPIPFEIKTYEFEDYSIVISKTPIENALTFDGDKIPPTAIIRTRLDGDIFKKFGGGTKKLKDYLIDKKIPRYSRDSIPILAVDNTVLAVFGVEISDDIKIDNTTKTTLYAKILYE